MSRPKPAELRGAGVSPPFGPETGPNPNLGDRGQEAGPSTASPDAISSRPPAFPVFVQGSSPRPVLVQGRGVTPSPEQLGDSSWVSGWLDEQPIAHGAGPVDDGSSCYSSMVPTWALGPDPEPVRRPGDRGLNPEPDGD